LLTDNENEIKTVCIHRNVFEVITLTSKTRFQILNTVPWLYTISENQPPRSRPIRRQIGDINQGPENCAPLCNTNPPNVSRQRMHVDYSIAFMFCNIFMAQNLIMSYIQHILSAFFHSQTLASCSTSSTHVACVQHISQ
jgi:hypothetical protein